MVRDSQLSGSVADGNYASVNNYDPVCLGEITILIVVLTQQMTTRAP